MLGANGQCVTPSLLFFVPSLAMYTNLLLGPRLFVSYNVRPLRACQLLQSSLATHRLLVGE